MQTTRKQFWKEWHRNYFNSLQVRKNWLNDSNNFNVGDLVLVADDNCRVLDWPLGRITKLFKEPIPAHVQWKLKLQNGTATGP